MEGPRSARPEELSEVVNLINKVFRTSEDHKPTMHMEFPLLLCEENIDNVIIIKEDDKVVSDVNYLNQNIVIEGAKIKAASIGAVCTDQDYRGRNHASKILDLVDEKMFKDGVDLQLISGTRGLYQRRMCTVVNTHYMYEINPKDIDIDFDIKDFEEVHLNKIIQMYNQNSTRYLRTYEEFKVLLESATISWGTFSYKKYVFTKNDNVMGYLILRVIDEENRLGQVIECFGAPNVISKALRKLSKDLSLDVVQYQVHVKDYYNHLEDYDSKKLDSLQGTIKIINYKKFMGNLKQYFTQYVEKSILDNISFEEREGKYFIRYKEEEVVIDNVGDLNKLVFEGNISGCSNLESSYNIKSFIEKAFPISFIWTSNLNFV